MSCLYSASWAKIKLVVDYVFNLGTRQFEQMSQALAYAEIGSALSVFGDGPDGGREASWDRQHTDGGDEFLTGFGVLQAKMRQFPETPAKNLAWVKDELHGELAKWAEPSSNRKKTPEKLLFATNVRLSPGNGGGKEQILSFASATAEALGLEVTVRVWDYADLCSRLDANDSIRRTYLAWILPGDVLSALLADHEPKSARLRKALQAHASRSFLDDAGLSLRQAGSTSNQPINLFEVFTDLPAVPYRLGGAPHGFEGQNSLGAFSSQGRFQPGVTSMLLDLADESVLEPRAVEESPSNRRLVLVGGPGQGKSTVTQYIAQLYRAAFLKDTPVATAETMARPLDELNMSAARAGLSLPAGRRWPIRIILGDFADKLANSETHSLLSYVASTVSKKSAVQLDAEDMLAWLGLYPWLLIIDGLDEVPRSSNRDEVLVAIRDFYLEAESAQADVISIATTRPQGYNGEFLPERYRHITLASLDQEQAMAYAAVLVEARSGKGSETAERTLSRLRTASHDPATNRLFYSPLQVSILTIIVEKIGQVPTDRWRLFSQYYEVMTNRELEKGGALAALLQRHESDIHFIHRRVAFQLQGRNAGAGETSATMTRNEFDEVLASRLREQEHPETEVSRLVAEFRDLTTERLVFLAVLSADRIGFEVRSLQEFMAGEYLVNLPERQVVPALTEIAATAYWRNVVLFAAGKIFIERENLKSEIVSMCAELDLADELSHVIKPGADLALDLLLDGSPIAQPRYSKPLAERAATLLTGIPTERAAELATIVDGEAGRIVRRGILDDSVAPAATWHNRATALAVLAKTDAEARTALGRAFSEQDARAQNALIQLAWGNDDPELDHCLSEVIATVNPFTLVGHGRPEADPAPDIVSALRVAFDRTRSEEDRFLIFATSAISLYIPHETRGPEWDMLSSVDSAVDGWPFIRSLAAFIAEPTPQGLSEVLEAGLPVLSSRHVRMASLPWQVRACLNEVLAGEESEYEAALQRQSQLARAGAMGSADDWQSIERRLGSYAGDWLAEGARSNSELPIDPAMTTHGLPWAALWNSLVMPENTEAASELLEVALEAGRVARNTAGATAFRRQAASASAFWLSSVWSAENDEIQGVLTNGAEQEILELSRTYLSLHTERDRLFWCDWLVQLSPDSWQVMLETGTLSALSRVKNLSIARFKASESSREQAFADWLSSFVEDDPWLSRLAFILRPSISSDAQALLPKDENQADTVVWRRFECAQRLYSAQPSDVANGHHDADIRTVWGEESNDSVTDLLANMIRAKFTRAPRAVAARAAEVLGESNIEGSVRFARIARALDA